MRIALVVGVVVAALFALVLGTGAVSTVIGGTEQQQLATRNLSCDAALGPWEGASAAAGRSAGGRLDGQQRAMAGLIIGIGKQRNLPPLAWQVALQAAMTESGLRNVPYGDRDSLGLFQMRPSQNWGSAAQILDPRYEVNKFYDVLTSVPDWQQQRPGDTAQDVERSAFPDRYHQWEALAAYLVSDVGGVADPTGCGEGFGNLLPNSEVAAHAIRYALGELGKPYVWGATGPDSYDCSGLMQSAFKTAGIRLPRVAADQFHAGAWLPVRQAQPGDLLFWASDPSNPATIHHVAMYLGNDQYVEAPDVGEVVRVSKINWNGHELVAEAVRPGV
ncbi:C40 family peptidase [Gandjariella thermophila]|uniref:Lipoprotein n=1 Tax=Gandjariella thermophila TaxID=1931992 RepID=A0A4D4JCN0_9PSEU|nr:C40 family peptidase [Gandjariella thermophila]GDY33132.1 lipoprotein [Gandjariella thermophila]